MTVIVICEGLGCAGAVANVAWQQALGLSLRQPVCLISDGLSAKRHEQLANWPGHLRLRILAAPRFTALRRFSHLPRELVWILLALRVAQHELEASTGALICHSHPMAAAVAWRFGQRVRLIMVSHGDIFHRPRGSYDPAITWLYRRTTGIAHRQAAWSVALSPVMAERIQAHGVPPESIALIPNGVDPSEIGLNEQSPTPIDHWQQSPLRLLFVGRLDPIKGMDQLLKALALARQDGLLLQLDVAGGGSTAKQRQLQALTEQLGLTPVVRWLGTQPRHNLAGHYQQCHVVVVPSLDDPLPTVVLEAMASGRPVVGSAVGGISFLIRDGINGLLVPPCQPHALAGAFSRLDQDRRFTASLGKAAHICSQRYSWAANVHALEALIQEPAT